MFLLEDVEVDQVLVTVTVSGEGLSACHSEEQRDEESLRSMHARPVSRDFSLTSFARNDMSTTYLFTIIKFLPGITGRPKTPLTKHGRGNEQMRLDYNE
jgi:hypothetical protein